MKYTKYPLLFPYLYAKICLLYAKAAIGSSELVCVFRECGMVGAAYVQHQAFPHELPPENFSRVRRVIPLQIYGVFAPKSCAL